MSRRPGENKDQGGLGGFLAAAAGVGIGAALLYGIYKANSEEEAPLQYSETDTVIADTEVKCQRAANVIERHCSNFEYLGMSCLWTNYPHNRRDRVALLQLATNQGFCLIIRLSDLRNNISAELKNILNDPNILKVGVGIAQWVRFLSDDHNIAIRGVLDLSLLAAEANISERSLTDLANVLCDMNVKKTNVLSSVNWSNANLSSSEKDYARKCAIAAIKVFVKLRENIVQSSGESMFRYYAIETRLADTD